MSTVYDGLKTALQKQIFKLMTYVRMGFSVNLPDVVLAPVVDEWSVLIQKGVL
jgi:hypothetical protein